MFLRNQKKQLLNFYKILRVSYKMETQKIINLLNDSSNEESKFATKKWYVIDRKTAKGKQKQGNTIKFETETIKSSLCDAFMLVTVDITVDAANDTLAPVAHVQQKLMTSLLMKQIIFTLQCLCTI